MTTPTHRVDLMRLDELEGLVNPRNAKAHAEADLELSILRFGFIEPVQVDEGNGGLLAGHGRLKVLRTMMNSRPGSPPWGVGVDVRDGMWLIPTLRGAKMASEVEARAYLLASNQIGIRGGWDPQALAVALREQGETSMRMAGLGFRDEDLARLTANLTPRLKPSSSPKGLAEVNPKRSGGGRGRRRGTKTPQEPGTGSSTASATTPKEESGERLGWWSTWREKVAAPEVKSGELWRLWREGEPEHILAVTELADGHRLWRHLLTDDHLIVHLPHPDTLNTQIARDTPLLLVCPEPWMATLVLGASIGVQTSMLSTV